MQLGVPTPQYVIPELVHALRDRHQKLAEKLDTITAQQAEDYRRFQLMIERGYTGIDSGLKLMAERLTRMENSNADLSKALLEDSAEAHRMVVASFEDQKVLIADYFKELSDNFARYFFRSVWLVLKRDVRSFRGRH